jgi:hypothetical protein
MPRAPSAERPKTHRDTIRGRATFILSEEGMAKRLRDLKEVKIERPPRVKLSAEESLKRTQEFDKRREKFIASVRKGRN